MNVELHLKKVVKEISDNEIKVCETQDLTIEELIDLQERQIKLGQLFQWLNMVYQSKIKENKIIPFAKTLL